MRNTLLLFSFLCGLLSIPPLLFGMNPLATDATFYIKNNDGFYLLNKHNQLEKVDNFNPSLKHKSLTLDPPSSKTLGAYSLSTPENIIAFIKPLSDEQVKALKSGLQKNPEQEVDRKILLAKIHRDNIYVHIKSANFHTIKDTTNPLTLLSDSSYKKTQTLSPSYTQTIESSHLPDVEPEPDSVTELPDILNEHTQGDDQNYRHIEPSRDPSADFDSHSATEPEIFLLKSSNDDQNNEHKDKVSSYSKPFFIITGLTLAGFVAAYLLYPNKVAQFLQSLRDTITNKLTAHNLP